MSLTQFTTDISYISALPDSPTPNGGYTKAQLKTEFDKAGNALKTFINETMITELDLKFTELNNTNANVQVANSLIGADGKTYENLPDRLDTIDKRTNVYVNILDYGGKANDNAFDNAVALQSALDHLEIIGGGVVKIPTGMFYFKGTITVPAYCSIEGAPCVSRAENKGTVLLHNDSITDITFIQFKEYAGDYCYGNTFKDLIFKGNGATGVVIDLDKTAYTLIENVTIEYGGTSLRINGGMLNTFKRLSMVYYRTYGLLIAKTNLTTTQRFCDVYIGQTTFSNTAIPLKIETAAVTDCTFYNLALESTQQGAVINMKNKVSFYDIYVENVGATQAVSIFNIGILEGGEVAPTSLNFKGLTYFVGGFIQGSALSNATENKNLFNTNCLDVLSVENVRYLGFNKTLVYTTANITNGITFQNCYGMGITSDINTITNTETKFKAINCGIATGGTMNTEGMQISGSDGSRVTKYDNGQMEIEMRITLGSTPITTSSGQLFISASIPLGDFPVAFVSSPIISMPYGYSSAGSTFWIKGVNAPTLTALPSIVLVKETSTTLADAIILVMAKGRWK